jgi:catechol 2,3-dioxygenase-like lactoylglutathione lyase family enzyme
MPDSAVFQHFNLVTSDMEASVAFYRLLGVEVPDTDPAWQSHHRNTSDRVDFDSTVFAQDWGWKAGMGVLVFGVASRDAVDETYARLTAAGYAGQKEPWDAPWGARFAIVGDPDGNGVGIMSPSDPERRYPHQPPAA